MKKTIIPLIFLLFLCGCAGKASYIVLPSAVPQKSVTKTAIPPLSGTNDSLPVIENDPWAQCAERIVSSPVPQRVGDIGNADYRRRVQITYMIQDQDADSTYIAERCMSGNLYTCLLDGTVNCGQKLDFSTEPAEAMKDFCSDPEMDGAILSPAVIGINSAFEWRCHEGMAVVTGQTAYPDADGYDASIWTQIPSPGE